MSSKNPFDDDYDDKEESKSRKPINSLAGEARNGVAHTVVKGITLSFFSLLRVLDY